MIKKLILAIFFLTVLLSLFACGKTADAPVTDGLGDITEPTVPDTKPPVISEFVETDANHVHEYFEAIIEPTCTSIDKASLINTITINI